MIESLCRTTNVNGIQGYITAASTPESQEYGYVFSNCKLISKDCPPNSVYLGRPWRNYAKTVFLECALGNHIHECGFMTGRKRMHEIRFCTQNIEITPHPAQTQHPITVP